MKKTDSIRTFTPFGGQGDINKRLYLRSFLREVEAQYQHSCEHDHCNEPIAYSLWPTAIDLGNYTKLIEEVAKKIQSGELPPPTWIVAW